MRLRTTLAALGAFLLGVYLGATARAIGTRLDAVNREQGTADGITDGA